MDSRRGFFGKAWAGLLGLFGVGTAAAVPMPEQLPLGRQLELCDLSGSVGQHAAVCPSCIPLPGGARIVSRGFWWQANERGEGMNGCVNLSFAWPEGTTDKFNAWMERETRDAVWPLWLFKTLSSGRAYGDVWYAEFEFKLKVEQ